jgi:hypothetical protein
MFKYTLLQGKRVKFMISITDGKWIADLGAMACRDIENRIVVTFTRNGKAFEGKLQDIPVKLLEEWAALPDGEKYIRQAVEEAEEVFLRAWFETQIEKENGATRRPGDS